MANPIQQGLKQFVFYLLGANARPQWLIQYNKDWNTRRVKAENGNAKAPQWLIQYNKDWNLYNSAK